MERPVADIHNLAAEFVHRNEWRFVGESGELFDFFNPLLKVVNGLNFADLGSTNKIYAAAALFHEISLLRGATSQNHNSHTLGWDAMNKDVKNWCKRMLVIPVPRDAGHEQKLSAFTAKGLIAHLLAEAIPQTLRDVKKVKEDKILDHPMDE
ncbi:MAG: hypothetical protein ACO1QB_18755 [Verrucomicrobiales bacterium]